MAAIPSETSRSSAHYVGHANGIKASLTVAENLRFWTEYLAEDDRDGNADRLDEALDHFNLLDLSDIPAGYLSAGQKRRLGLARLLVAHRPLWLLDEPTVSLDTASDGAARQGRRCALTGGGIAIAATHIPLGLPRRKRLRLSAGAAEAA